MGISRVSIGEHVCSHLGWQIFDPDLTVLVYFTQEVIRYIDVLRALVKARVLRVIDCAQVAYI